jgi:hypothetical protein
MKRRLLARFGRMLAWLGFIATVLFGIVGIYSGFFYSRICLPSRVLVP